MARSSKYGHRARWAGAHDKAVDKDRLERALAEAKADQAKKGAMGKIGRGVGMLAAVGLTLATGGATAPLLAVAAGAGSAVGSMIGEGKRTSLDFKGRFYQEEKQIARESIGQAEEAQDKARWVNAASDAFSAFTLGGGTEAFKVGAKAAAGEGMKAQIGSGIKSAMAQKVTAADLMKNTLSSFGLDKVLGKDAGLQVGNTLMQSAKNAFSVEGLEGSGLSRMDYFNLQQQRMKDFAADNPYYDKLDW